MYQNQIDFYVKVNGRNLTEFQSQKHNDNRTFVEGRKDSIYELIVQNHSSIRKKAVISVDGLNILSGDSTWERGYVVEPWQTLTIPGWRINESKVADFKFSSVKGSYNQHNDDGVKKNVGVIGCMIFDEEVKYNYINVRTVFPVVPWPTLTPYWPVDPYRLSETQYTSTIGSANPNFGGFSDNHINLNASGSVDHEVKSSTAISSITRSKSRRLTEEPQSGLGTAWGEESKFETKFVNYDFYSSTSAIFEIHYDNRKGLEDRGIDLDRGYQSRSEPDAFPGYRNGCPKPKYSRVGLGNKY